MFKRTVEDKALGQRNEIDQGMELLVLVSPVEGVVSFSRRITADDFPAALIQSATLGADAAQT